MLIGQLIGSDNGNDHAESERKAHHKRFISSLRHYFEEGARGVTSGTGGHCRGTPGLHPLWVSFLTAVSECVYYGYDVRAVYLRMQEVGLISNSLRVTDSLLGDTQTEGPRVGREGTWVGAADSVVSEVSHGLSVIMQTIPYLLSQQSVGVDVRTELCQMGRRCDVLVWAASVACLL